MRCLVSIAVFLPVFAFVPLAAQDDGHNEFIVYHFKTLPGRAAAYNALLQELTVPYCDEQVRRELLVSYQLLVQDAGAGDYTVLLILEFADWDAANDRTQYMRNDVCRTVFSGLTCAEKMAEVERRCGARTTLRTLIRTEHYMSIKP